MKQVFSSRSWWTQLAPCLLFWTALAGAQTVPPLQRQPNTTLNLPLEPPVFGYTLTNAFGNLSFADPVVITSPPGETNRLFVVEQRGRISVITNLAAPNRTLFLDLASKVAGGVPSDERGLLGLAFHPGYATNRHFFVFYTGNATTAAPGGANSLHDILSRFQTSEGNPDQADPASEVRLIVQRDEANNHNGGDLHFGPDGYLYAALGDEGGGNDTYNNSQTITRDFFAGLIRIDVDRRPDNLPPNPHPAATTNYAVPRDNPFVGARTFNGAPVNPASVRTEFWAVGLRNPWRFSFDSLTGDLYCADVGQNLWEEINIITRGGNYGWAFREGRRAGPKTPTSGFTSIDPVLDYSHGSGPMQGFSVTGGIVYRGARFSQLYGAYVFADYVSGNIWSMRYNGANATDFQRLTTQGGIAGFGVDPANGDVLLANQTLNSIQRLVYAPNPVGQPLPPTLADTGAFADPATLETHAGIVPYDINVPFWSDNARKTRWFSLPDTNLTFGFSRDQNWALPSGAVWIKHFEIELTNGVPASRKRLETRFLVKNTEGMHGFTYRWDDAATNAVLVPEEGADETFQVDDGNGALRTQVWRYPSRQECKLCHTPAAGFALGFNTAQLNREADYGGMRTNQIAALSLAGYFDAPVTGIHTLPLLAHATNLNASLEFRVRSYLAANCASCHQPGGAPQSTWDARFSTPTPLAGLVDALAVDNLGDPANRMVKPGSPAQSILLRRISTNGPGRMPPLASSVLDTQAIQLVAAWITNDLPAWQSYADWQTARFGSPTSPDAAPFADPDGDRGVNQLEFLTGTDPLDPRSLWPFEIAVESGAITLRFSHLANRAFEIQSTTHPHDPASWAPLDTPGNEPFFPANNTARTIRDPIPAGGGARFYRVRLFAP
jgi:uncharacterized repeat protein (TIGR03806 family)